MIYEYFVIASLLAGSALVTTTIWSREQTRMRLAAMVLFMSMLPVLLGSGLFALGHPAPWMMLNALPGGEYEVLSVKYEQDEAIYVWFDQPNDAPFSVKYPWDNELADKLWNAMHSREGYGPEGAGVSIPYDPSLDSEDFIPHPLPQSKQAPEKKAPIAPPTYYRNRNER